MPIGLAVIIVSAVAMTTKALLLLFSTLAGGSYLSNLMALRPDMIAVFILPSYTWSPSVCPSICLSIRLSVSLVSSPTVGVYVYVCRSDDNF